jgi:hypothetical protein
VYCCRELLRISTIFFEPILSFWVILSFSGWSPTALDQTMAHLSSQHYPNRFCVKLIKMTRGPARGGGVIFLRARRPFFSNAGRVTQNRPSRNNFFNFFNFFKFSVKFCQCTRPRMTLTTSSWCTRDRHHHHISNAAMLIYIFEKSIAE